MTGAAQICPLTNLALRITAFYPRQPRITKCSDRTQGARGTGEGEFAGDEIIVRIGCGELMGGEEDAEGDGQVVTGTLFAEIAGRQIDRGARAGSLAAAVVERRPDAITRFFDGGVRQADEKEPGFARLARVDFDMDQLGLDALQRGGGKRSEHDQRAAAAAAVMMAILRLIASI